VSAHWESAPLSITSAEAGTDLVYDFGGFHPMYYRMRYDTPDAGDLARQVVVALPDTETVHEHRNHGAWVPPKVMYPDARVPVLQLSIPTRLFVTLGAATDPSAPVTTTVGGYFLGLAKRSFEAA
jgi:4,5-DOPA dioxygenase extradiol